MIKKIAHLFLRLENRNQDRFNTNKKLVLVQRLDVLCRCVGQDYQRLYIENRKRNSSFFFFFFFLSGLSTKEKKEKKKEEGSACISIENRLNICLYIDSVRCCLSSLPFLVIDQC